jgi:hypothetical protein
LWLGWIAASAHLRRTKVAADRMLYGTADEITDRLEALRCAGIRYVLLNVGGLSRDSLRSFARDIMPVFATD